MPPKSLVCTTAVPCDAHRVGDASPDDKCPGYCDAAGCRAKALMEVGRAGHSYCRKHARERSRLSAGRLVSTGSDSTRPIFFRIGSAERERGERVAAAAGLRGATELAKRAFLAALTPSEPAPRSLSRRSS